MRRLCVCLILVGILASCSRDPNVVKKRYLDGGNKYFEKGKYKEASLMYRTALQKDAKYGEAYYRLALTSLEMHLPNEALSALRRAVELLKPGQPERTEARIKLSNLYLDYLEATTRREKEIIGEVQQTSSDLLKADPKSFDGHRIKGRLFFISAVDAANKRNSMQVKDELQNAIAEFKLANATKPSEPDLIIYLCRALTADAQYAESEKLYRDLVERRKDFVQPYIELYTLYQFQNKPDQAEAILKKAIENNPRKYDLLLNLAQHQYMMKRRDEVVKVLEQLKSHSKDYPQAFEKVGAFYFRLGDGAEAMRQYQQGMAANPSRKSLYQKLIIEVLMAQGKKEDAKKVNDEILQADPKDTDALGLRAALLLDKGDLQNAVNQLQTVVTRAPQNFVAHFNLGRGLAEKGEWEQARSHYNEAIRLRPDYVAARLALAQLQLNRREFDAAVKTVTETLAYDRNNVGAKLLRTAGNLGLGKMPEAREELTKILQENPTSQDALFQMGLLLISEGKYKEAEEVYRKCYDLNPTNARGLMGMVEVMMAARQPDRAMQLLRSEIAKFPTRLEFRLALANIEVRAEKYDQAIAEFSGILDKVDRKSPMAADLYVRLGETYRRAQNVQGAIDAMQKAKEILPNNAIVLNSLALMLDTAGQKKEAKVVYENALRIESENPIALNNLAFIIAESIGGDLDQALTFAQRANQKLPDVAEIADTLGWIYLKKNLPDNAIDIFRANLKKFPQHSTYRYHLGLALHQKGDKVGAKQELQRALESHPTKEEATTIKELMAK